jgi:hypothetical protein
LPNNKKEISRFVCIDNKNNYCRTSDGTVKPKAFKPTQKGETSVFVNAGLSETDVWELGVEHVCTTQKPLYGRADVASELIQNCGLRLVVDNSPKRHANITNWPSADEKEKIQEIAQVLAADASCYPYQSK